jgi:hypothetical protein
MTVLFAQHPSNYIDFLPSFPETLHYPVLVVVRAKKHGPFPSPAPRVYELPRGAICKQRGQEVSLLLCI